MTHVSTLPIAPDSLHFSRLVVGLMRLLEWRYTPQELLDWIEAVMDMGITTFDHADIYGGYQCEAAFGEALRLRPALRQRMQLVTKCGIMLLAEARPQTRVHHYDTTRAHIIASAEQSLRNLHTDVIDLLLIHRPDPLMDADEVADALTTLRDAGKVRYVGVSNFTPWQLDLLQSRLAFPLVNNQVEFSPVHMEPMHDGTFDQCQRHRIAPMVWSPLGGGGLLRGDSERDRRVLRALEAVGQALGGVPADQVALAWVMQHPVRPIPVLGTGRLERIRSAAQAEHVTLDRQMWFAIWEASAGHEVP